jgi:inosine/xanthosine triphosphatase
MDKAYVCVGSLNPTKIKATKLAFLQFFEDIILFHIDADSKVSDQPIGRNNIIKGAKNRATQSLNYLIKEKGISNKIYGVGIEAGLVEIPETRSGYMDFQFCAMINEYEEISIGSGIGFEYPSFVIEEILNDRSLEIGDIMANLANKENLKYKKGAIGFLSRNRIKRTDILREAVICALLPIINMKLYSKKEI